MKKEKEKEKKTYEVRLSQNNLSLFFFYIQDGFKEKKSEY